MIDIEASLEATARQNHEGCVKTWEDLERYSSVISLTQPDLIIECGTFSGKSALWFERTADCLVFTVDTTPHIDPEIRERMDAAQIIDVVDTSLSSPVIFQAKRCADAAERVMVVLDSDHSAAHVLAEMEAYGPFVTPGCYMVVEDGLLRYMPQSERRHYTGDPLGAIEAFMAKHGDEWTIDEAVENMHPVTQFPSGWLRKR